MINFNDTKNRALKFKFYKYVPVYSNNFQI